MIENNFTIPKEEKKSFPPLPEGIYQVELTDVNAELRPTYDTRLKPDNEKILENVLKFQFTLLNGKDGATELRGRSLWENFVPARLYIGKNGKNKLYQIAESLIARDLTPQEEATMDASKINELIGMQCVVGVKQKKSGDKIRSHIEQYYRAQTQLEELSFGEKESESGESAGGAPIPGDTTAGISFGRIPF